MVDPLGAASIARSSESLIRSALALDPSGLLKMVPLFGEYGAGAFLAAWVDRGNVVGRVDRCGFCLTGRPEHDQHGQRRHDRHGGQRGGTEPSEATVYGRTPPVHW